MKTSKETSEPRETASLKKDPGTKKTRAEYKADEEEIRIKAEEIYHDRISRGEHGDALQDWLEAEKALKNSRESDNQERYHK